MSDSPLFFVLPLPQFTDRLARPVVVITLCQVTRDENGSLEEMKEWTWWALEMVRRVLRDWWVKGAWGESGNKHRARVRKRGYGGEGCVLVVDASGASYRNLVSQTVLGVTMLTKLLFRKSNCYPPCYLSVTTTFPA
jgi:hypothetical protein